MPEPMSRSGVTQPVSKPQTLEEYERIRPLMIDTWGRPLVSEWCGACRSRHFTVQPCAGAVACPRCGSRRVRCLRPSGHEADSWHRDRQAAYDRHCDELEAAGRPQVARWAKPSRAEADR